MRTAALVLGLAALAAVWFLPLQAVVPGPFSAHMTMHMGVVAVAAPLIAIGVARRRFDPVRVAPRLFPPIPVSVVELVVVWGWHTPAAHHLARGTVAGFVLEQGSFLVSGLLVWMAAFGGAARERESRGAAGIVALLLTSMHMTLLGALLALPPRPLFDHGAAAGHPAPAASPLFRSLTPLEDQHLGGAIMLLVGGASYLAGGLWLTVQLLRTREARAREARAARVPAAGGTAQASRAPSRLPGGGP